MKPAFGDTFYWIALTLPSDSSHEVVSVFRGDIVTTDEVLTEYLSFFSRSSPYLRSVAVTNVEAIMNDPGVRVLPQSRESVLAGLDLFRHRADKGYSLTDCISMQVMRQEGLSVALTNDRHFEQEGFRALFRESVS